MKKAFTTAELLISLVIIGTIAMLVIPTFVKDYNMKLYSTIIKDTYSNIMAAMERACADKNVTYFAHTGYDISDGVIENFMTNYYKGTLVDFDDAFASSYKSLNGTVADTDSRDFGFTIYKLQNGVVIAMSCDTGERVCTYDIDINGPANPNLAGIDKFRMSINTGTNRLIGEGAGTCSKEALGDNCVQELLDNDWDMEAYTIDSE